MILSLQTSDFGGACPLLKGFPITKHRPEAKRKHRLKPAVPGWSNFDSYPFTVREPGSALLWRPRCAFHHVLKTWAVPRNECHGIWVDNLNNICWFLKSWLVAASCLQSKPVWQVQGLMVLVA